ncbi:MAG: hypothetical protein KatS3mg002_1164 [Candidatus Woesearchaeota archaeon]|nr:MAG: hypothetical protein KatS3mg002_1164 [Candidatus Woesearchaeota archaeon]
MVMIMSKKNIEKKSEKSNSNEKKNMESSKEEQIGFHKGALSTLSKERAELARLLQIVEQLMQMHVAALNQLGVDLTKEVQQMKEEKIQSKKKPIEEVL